MHTWRQAVELLGQAGVTLVERSATLNHDGAPTRGEWVWERLRGRAYEGKEMPDAARIAAVRWLLDLLCWERLRVRNYRPPAGVGATIAPLHKQAPAHGVSSDLVDPFTWVFTAVDSCCCSAPFGAGHATR